jgi:SAM-dependent methyltransferase
MALIPILKGLVSFIPGTRFLFSRKSQGTYSARYCYSVWLRHLSMACKQGLIDGPPRVVAELGPGDSLGVGIAALISGCESCRAFDVVRYANAEANLRIFEELVRLFETCEDIPGEEEFPLLGPRLDSYGFPATILTKDCLQAALERRRLEAIRAAIASMTRTGEQSELISYTAPWSTVAKHQESCIDMVVSQAVMEHVDDLPGSYQAMFRWLKPGGFASHQIDFKCHNTARLWNGHWAYPDWLWTCVKGRRPYLINRVPHSLHISMMGQSGFEIVLDRTTENSAGIGSSKLVQEFCGMSDQDLITSGAFVQARKPL